MYLKRPCMYFSCAALSERIQLDLIKQSGDERDLYSELVFEEFLLCVGHLF